MTKPNTSIAVILLDGILYACSPCQSSPEGTAHAPPHYCNGSAANRSGVTRVEWVDVPKRKRTKAGRKGGRRG